MIKRKRIVVTPYKVEVMVTKGTEESKITSFVEYKKNWVFTNLQKVNKRAEARTISKRVHYRTGSKILYRGRMMRLNIKNIKVRKIGKTEIKYKNGFYVKIPEIKSQHTVDDKIRSVLEKWMKGRIWKYVKHFVHIYGKKTNIFPEGFRIKEQKHLWGSCGKDRIININWRFISAPKQLLEYVVVHEVCHLRYRNHSDEFWKLLVSVFPGYEICKNWLDRREPEELSF